MAPGVRARRLPGFLSWQCEVRFDGVEVPASALLGGRDNQGWAALERALGRALPVLCSYMVGGCQAVYEMSVKHSQQRVQFGVPIGRFQRVQDHIIRLVNHLDAARWTTAEALWKLDTGRAGDRRRAPGQGRDQRELHGGVQRRARGPRGPGEPHGVRPGGPHADVAHALRASRRSALAQAPDGRRAGVVVVSEQPFAGVTVLEFGHFIAVPWAGQVLADGGAHVIKIEPLEGEPSRHIAPLGGGESRPLPHPQSRQALAATRSAPSRRPPILDALLARADVVLANMRPGLAAELGLEYEQLAPRIRASSSARSPRSARREPTPPAPGWIMSSRRGAASW